MPYLARPCIVCTNIFTPNSWGKGKLDTGGNFTTHCAKCRRSVKAVLEAEALPSDTPVAHRLAAPLTQVVFDLETWGLDRGWGVTLVASFLIHGGAEGPVKKTFALRDYPSWKRGIRSDDSGIVQDIFATLKTGQIAYAHNGEYFDIRWLRTVALKYGFEMPHLKLIDPAQIARRKYLVGRNSLESMADFIGPRFMALVNGGIKGLQSLQKMHITPDTWRSALLDNDQAAWEVLIARCESDVMLLNSVASAVTGDVGMVDYMGSSR